MKPPHTYLDPEPYTHLELVCDVVLWAAPYVLIVGMILASVLAY